MCRLKDESNAHGAGSETVMQLAHFYDTTFLHISGPVSV